MTTRTAVYAETLVFVGCGHVSLAITADACERFLAGVGLGVNEDGRNVVPKKAEPENE